MKSCVCDIGCQHANEDVVDHEIEFDALGIVAEETTVEDEGETDQGIQTDYYIEVKEILCSAQILDGVLFFVDAVDQLKGLEEQQKHVYEWNTGCADRNDPETENVSRNSSLFWLLALVYSFFELLKQCYFSVSVDGSKL